MQTILNNDYLQRYTPSVFATEPHADTSKRYQFYPTIEIIDAMRKEQFFPVWAKQTDTRVAGKETFARHMIRFRHDKFINKDTIGEEIPEVVLVNSHDGKSSYQLHAGIFRLVCSNGMIVASTNINSMRIKHSKHVLENVIEGSYTILQESVKAFDAIEKYKQVELTKPMQYSYAQAAATLKANVIPEQLLLSRRIEDSSNSLWHTLNKVQENLIRGGITQITNTGRERRSRGITSINENIRINRTLWHLTEAMHKRAA